MALICLIHSFIHSFTKGLTWPRPYHNDNHITVIFVTYWYRYSVSADTHSISIGIGIGREKMVSEHLYLSLTYTPTPPPFLFPDASERSARTSEKPSRLSRESGTPWWSHVSVNTMMLDSRYSKQLFRLTRSSSNFGVSDRTLLSIIDGSGGLLIRRRRRSRTPPRLPRLRCGRVLVCVARIAAGR